MRIFVSFEAEIQDEATRDQIKEYVEFQLGARGGCSAVNPLVDADLEAISGSISIC